MALTRLGLESAFASNASLVATSPWSCTAVPAAAVFAGRHSTDMGAGAQVMNENESPLLNATRASLGWTNLTGSLSSGDFTESNKMHQMNGFVFCNAPGMDAPMGRKCAAQTLLVSAYIVKPCAGQGLGVLQNPCHA